MAVNLTKGQGVSLKKSEYDLSTVTIGLGWDLREAVASADKTHEYDLDAVAFLCGPDGKVHDLGWDANGKATLRDSDVVFFNNLKHRSGCIWLTGDSRAGGSAGDDEQIVARLNDLPDVYAKVVFVVQLFEGRQRGQSFGQVKNAHIRAVDGQGREMARFDLSGGPGFDGARSMLFAELTREASGWRFDAIGAVSESDTLVEWLKQYL